MRIDINVLMNFSESANVLSELLRWASDIVTGIQKTNFMPRLC